MTEPRHDRRTAFLFWLGAIATALFELGARFLAGADIGGRELLVRFSAYLLLLTLATLMLKGSALARHALALIYGVLGTLSLVVEPVSWLAGGGGAGQWLSAATGLDLVAAVSRLAHVACVFLGVWFMYRRRR